MKRGRRSKEPMTKEQIEKKKKKIIKRFIIIVAIIILAIIAYIANDFIILDKNEKTNLVINNNNITSNLKNDILIENDIIYLSKQDIANFFDKYIYEEKEEYQASSINQEISEQKIVEEIKETPLKEMKKKIIK